MDMERNLFDLVQDFVPEDGLAEDIIHKKNP